MTKSIDAEADAFRKFFLGHIQSNPDCLHVDPFGHMGRTGAFNLVLGICPSLVKAARMLLVTLLIALCFWRSRRENIL
jgi:hypothetical protein